jgi:hypothetical protein
VAGEAKEKKKKKKKKARASGRRLRRLAHWQLRRGSEGRGRGAVRKLQERRRPGPVPGRPGLACSGFAWVGFCLLGLYINPHLASGRI